MQVPAIEVKKLTKTFGKFSAVDDISFEVYTGEIFGFLGPNGAGKSTTIKMLCGLLKPTKGNASVAGYDIFKQKYEVRKNIGYMSQKFSLYEDLTAEENIHFYGGIYQLDKNELIERKNYLIELIGLVGNEKQFAKDLPTGLKQRLALICALIHNPKILFLDEPTAGVDPVARRNFWNHIYSLAELGTTVFVTTHYLDEAEYCNRISLIYNGKIKATGTPGELKKQLEDIEIHEIICDRPIDALSILQKENWIKDISLFGNALHVGTTLPENGKERISQLLFKSSIKVTSIQKIIPSLEDVFIYLTKENAEK